MVTSETSEKGDLVRWVKEYTFYAADDRGNAWPHDPIYEYGLVMQTSHVDPSALIVFGFRTKSLFIVDMKYDEVEKYTPCDNHHKLY